MSTTEFQFQDLLPLAEDTTTPYRLLTTDFVSTFEALGKTFLRVEPEALTSLSRAAMHDIAHLLRPGHLAQLRAILDDPEASPNDRFVALELLKNANIAAAGVLPGCQDTGTAIIMGKKGQYVFTGGGDEAAIARGVFQVYAQDNLRYSQLAPIDIYKEANTGTNLPAQIEIFATDGDAYKFLFMAKGGGSANKSLLFQETKALLNPQSLMKFLDAKLRSLGTAACPPYHLAIVIGGTSAEYTLKVAKLASARYLDGLPVGRERARARVPRSRARGGGAGAGAEDGNRRPIRRKVFLPRRAGGATASARSLLPGRPSPSPARRTARRWVRSRATAFSSNNWRPIRPSTCRMSRRPSWGATSCASTSAAP